ncbi:MAG: GGDEF domain-containing protein [Planctomycetes bacterium]|nr:GGDEF domain-containing protein [Planctomycetota bacterium]
MSKGSINNQRLKYKLSIMYAVMTIIPVLFLLFIILQLLFPELKVIFKSDNLFLTLTIGVGGILLMSFAGILLMYRSVRSLENLTHRTEIFMKGTSAENPTDIRLVTDDETEKISHYFTSLVGELQKKMAEVNKYAIELSEANRKLSQLALKDGLTDLFNQTYIKERLGQEFARARKFKHSLSVMMIDLDNFKEFNDKYGHLNGDHALKKVAETILHNIRIMDVAGRYGGEEFMVILPETETSIVQGIGEKIKNAVASFPFIDTTDNERGHLTISVGITTYPNSADNGNALIVQADEALYQAKRKGKNQVLTYI